MSERTGLVDHRILQRVETEGSELGVRQGHLSLTAAFASVFASCALWVAVFVADGVVVLPRLWFKCKVDFFLQAVFLVAGGALGSYSTTTEMGIWGKAERVPKWLRVAIIIGSCGLFFLVPSIVLGAAAVAWIKGNPRLMSSCRQACFWVYGAGLLQLVLGLLVQTTAEIALHEDLLVSLAIGYVLIIKVAAEHDTHQHVYLHLRYIEGPSPAAEAQWEESTPLITGPLESIFCARGLLAAVCRAAEVASSLGCVAVFDAGTRSWLKLWGVGMGGPLLVLAQFIAQLVAFHLSSGWMSTGAVRAFVATVFVPKPLLDVDVAVLEHYVVMAFAQGIVIATYAMSMLEPPPTRFQQIGVASAVGLMWVLLIATRLAAVKSAMPGGAVQLADKVKAGVVQLLPLYTDHSQVPQLTGFCRAFATQFFGPAFEAANGTARVDLSGSELEAATVSTALFLMEPLMSEVTAFELNLEGTAVDDADIAELVQHLPPNLESFEINLAGTNVGDVGVVTLAQHLPDNLTSFEAGFNSTMVTDKGLAVLAQHLPLQLTNLQAIFYNTQVGDKGLIALAKRLPRTLTSLRAGFFRTMVGDAGVTVLAEHLPDGLLSLKAELSGTQVGDAGASALAEHLPLRIQTFEANVAGTKVSEEVKAQLASAAATPTFRGRVKNEDAEIPEKTYCCRLIPFV